MKQRLMTTALRATARRAGVSVLLALGGALLFTVLSWLFSGSAASAESGEEAQPLTGVVDSITATLTDEVHHSPVRTVESAVGLDKVERFGGRLRHDLDAVVRSADVVQSAPGAAATSAGDGSEPVAKTRPPARPVLAAAPAPPPPPSPPVAAPAEASVSTLSAPVAAEAAARPVHGQRPAGPAAPLSSPPIPRQVPAAPAGVSASGHVLDLGALAGHSAAPAPGEVSAGAPRTTGAAVAHPALTQPGVTPD